MTVSETYTGLVAGTNPCRRRRRREGGLKEGGKEGCGQKLTPTKNKNEFYEKVHACAANLCIIRSWCLREKTQPACHKLMETD